jgi:hypothetical protein
LPKASKVYVTRRQIDIHVGDVPVTGLAMPENGTEFVREFDSMKSRKRLRSLTLRLNVADETYKVIGGKA